MDEYIKLLKKEPILRRLSLIQLIAYFGAWFSNVAIYTLLVQLDVSAFTIALVASFHFLPGVLQAPISGVLIDKISPKKLMLSLVVLEIISTFCLLLVTSSALLWLLFVLVFIRMGSASFYFTIEMSLLPKILEGKSLQYANEIHSIIWSLSYTLGMAMSGFLVYKLGVSIAFIVDGFLFILAFSLLYKLDLHIEFEKAQESFVKTFKEGLVYIRSNKKVLHLIIIHASVGFTVFDALVTLMAKHLYSEYLAIPLTLGLIHATRALALVLGPILLGKWINSSRLGYLFLMQGLGIIVWGSFIENIYLSLLGAFVSGFSTTTLWSYTYTLIQKHTEKKFYGRVVAYNDMVFLFTGAMSSLLVGVLIESSWKIQSVLYLLGSAFFMMSLYYIYVRKVYHV
ncbi:MFS transporter [Sulfurimonas sp. MAG313]|nr:MFS transporter [Sulfurimonas sp. MAG313]MDF1881576.1 MFS transporter [Sulfurimonas sp. MAG313]